MNEELELIQGLTDSFVEFKKKSNDKLALVEKDANEAKAQAEELKAAKADAEKWWKELTEKVEQVNKDLAEKGATLAQAQEAIQEFKAKAGRVGHSTEEMESTHSILRKALADNFETISEAVKKSSSPRFDFHVKDAGNMTAANNLSGNVVATYASMGPAVRGRRRLHFRDLVQTITSATGLWKFYRQNSPVGEGSFGFQTTHGDPKNKIDYDLTEVTVTVDYLAGFARIAKQMLQDLPFLQTYVVNEMIEDYLRTESGTFFSQLTGAATGSAITTGANAAERIIDNIAEMEDRDWDVSDIIVTGSVWADILKTSKGTGYGIPGGVVVAPNGDVLFMGIPLRKNPASSLGTDKILLGDFSKVAIVQTEGLNIATSEHDSDNFQRNMVTVKAEARVACAILRPDAFSYFAAK